MVSRRFKPSYCLTALEKKLQREKALEMERKRELERQQQLEKERQQEIEKKIEQEAKRKAEQQRKRDEEVCSGSCLLLGGDNSKTTFLLINSYCACL